MTVKNSKKARGDRLGCSAVREDRSNPTKRLCQRYLLPFAMLTLASSAVPLFSTAASAAQEPISPQSTAPVVSYGDGLATVEVDSLHDVVLFTEPSGSTSWSMKTIAAAKAGTKYFNPGIASDGNGDLTIAAVDAGGHLWSWSGSIGTKLHRTSVSDTSKYSTPSIAYSPTGENFVISATDSAGNVDFWYQSAGSWAPELVQTGQLVHFFAAVATVTDAGVVVVATDEQQELDAFYQPFFASGWTLTSTAAGGYIDPSAVWNGTDVLVAIDKAGVQAGDQSLDVKSYSDKGIFVSDTPVGESTTAGDLTGTAIVWSGFNAGVVSQDSEGDGALNFFYSDSNFVFHEESVATGTPHRDYGFFPGIAAANSSIEITDVSNADLYGFSQAIGGSGWSRQVIAK
jgi:hypothetical protein